MTAAPCAMSLQTPLRTQLEPLGDRAVAAPTWHHAEVLAHQHWTDRYHYLRLAAPSIAQRCQPGQFVMLTAARNGDASPVLPRPMAIYSHDDHAIEIVYGVLGKGTQLLTGFQPGEQMLVVGPLGRGFQIAPDTDRVLLVGRGIGTCSLTTVAQDNARRRPEIATVAVASGRTSSSVIGGELYRRQGAEYVVEVTDTEGTSSVEQLWNMLTTRLDHRPPQQLFTCGSQRLAQLCVRLAQRWDASVQVSLEAHMACGLGYCHGCATGAGADGAESPLICVDGPVFRLTAADGERA
jgi:dihydroorotate dehydrogenase electron transfer subunit